MPCKLILLDMPDRGRTNAPFYIFGEYTNRVVKEYNDVSCVVMGYPDEIGINDDGSIQKFETLDELEEYVKRNYYKNIIRKEKLEKILEKLPKGME